LVISWKPQEQEPKKRTKPEAQDAAELTRV
jgi:hypothetical protein